VNGLVAAAPYYGGGILDNADLQPKVPVMGHFGDKDAHIPVEGVKKLAEKHPQHQIFIYGRRPRLQLRPARLLQCAGDEAGARTDASVLPEARRLIRLTRRAGSAP